MVINDYEKAKSLFAETEIKIFRKGETLSLKHLFYYFYWVQLQYKAESQSCF